MSTTAPCWVGIVLCVVLGAVAEHTAGEVVEPCSAEARRTGWRPPVVHAADGEVLDFSTLVDKLAERRVVFVGESHDRFDHHLNQLEIICGLHRRHPDLVIAMEFFQRPAQPHLDAFVEGRTDESEMLLATGYYERWRYDYRLYQPILDFARQNAIPLVALNVPSEITQKVGRDGIASLSDEERSAIPDVVDRSDTHYRARIKEVFEHHPAREHGDFETFFEVQLLWDEGMAERAADYLDTHGGHMVVLAGVGHVLRSGVPQRFARRNPARSAVVLQADPERSWAEEGDFLLASVQMDLPPAGMLGVMLETDAGRVNISGLAKDGAAGEAGLKTGDSIVLIDGRRVREFTDVKLVLMDKRPGDTVRVEIGRPKDEDQGPRETLAIDVTLR